MPSSAHCFPMHAHQEAFENFMIHHGLLFLVVVQHHWTADPAFEFLRILYRRAHGYAHAGLASPTRQSASSTHPLSVSPHACRHISVYIKLLTGSGRLPVHFILRHRQVTYTRKTVDWLSHTTHHYHVTKSRSQASITHPHGVTGMSDVDVTEQQQSNNKQS